jgi:uncharacterized protein involved in exopolysaccharide biosynthesis
MEQDEIYLIDMWRILVREWRWFVGVLIAVLACTYVLVHSVKPQWEASAWIQVGQVGQVPTGQDPKIEPLQRVAERLQFVPFENEVMERAGFAPDSPEASLYRSSLKLDSMMYAGAMIKLTVRARSPQQAQQFATATVAQLREIHQRLEAAPLKIAHARLDQVQADLQDALADRTRLLQATASTSKDDAASKSVAGVLLASKNEQISKLQEQQSDLAGRLGPAYTFETSLVWPVYVPRFQAFPNHLLFWGLGLLLGVFLAALAATARDLARRASANRATA